jgi:hypothetical protein
MSQALRRRRRGEPLLMVNLKSAVLQNLIAKAHFANDVFMPLAREINNGNAL